MLVVSLLSYPTPLCNALSRALYILLALDPFSFYKDMLVKWYEVTLINTAGYIYIFSLSCGTFQTVFGSWPSQFSSSSSVCFVLLTTSFI